MTSPIASPTSYALRRNESVAKGLGRILNQLAGETSLVARYSNENSSDQIHGLRILIKRLRALVWFAAPVVRSPVACRVTSRLRTAAHLLAAQRDAVVTRSTLQALSQRASNSDYRKGLLQISIDLNGSHTSGTTLARAFKEAATIVIEAIKEIIPRIKTVTSWPKPFDRLLRAFHATNKAGKRALKSERSARFHTWRKKAKRLFYLLQMTQALLGKRMARLIERVDDLQGKLGQYHDCVVAQNHLLKNGADKATSGLIRHNVNLLKKKKNRLKEVARTLARHIKPNTEIIRP